MPVTLFDAVRRARSQLNEPALPTTPTASNAGAQYTDTELTDWINDGLRDFARRGEGLRTYDTSITIPAYGETPSQPIPTFALPGDVLRINRVEFQVAGDSSQVYPLEFTTPQYLDQMWGNDQISTRTYPTYWITRGYCGGTGRNQFVIQLYPQSSQAGQLNLWYYREPVRVADPVANPANYLVTLDCLEGWDDMIVDYACMQALIKTRNPGWEVAQKAYAAKMDNAIDQTRMVSDQATYMTYDNPMGWGGWDMGGGDWW